MSTAYYEQEFRFGFADAGITYMVRLLILTTIGAFAIQTLASIPLGMRFPVDYFGYRNGALLQGWIWMPVSYMFLHGGLMHLFQNMLPLFFFGPTVERALGSRQFLLFYLGCGMVGALVNLYRVILPGTVGEASVLGASGATLAVLAAFVTIDPERRIFLFPFPLPITARGLLIIVIAFNLVFVLFNAQGVAVATHFAGMGAGWTYMKFRPRWAAMQLRRRAQRASRPRSEPTSEDQDELRKAVDNIFNAQDKFRKR
jgi:membrane associated rhomboid family serine protease